MDSLLELTETDNPEEWALQFADKFEIIDPEGEKSLENMTIMGDAEVTELLKHWFANAMETAKRIEIEKRASLDVEKKATVETSYRKEQALHMMVQLNAGRAIGVDELIRGAKVIMEFLDGKEDADKS